MNLHAIASAAISAVNPMILATMVRSKGYRVGLDYSQIPQYADPITVSVQVQPVQAKELAQYDLINQEGLVRSVHLNGDWQGIVRADRKGGDLLKFGGYTWLVVQVAETWPDWCRVIVCQQLPSS